MNATYQVDPTWYWRTSPTPTLSGIAPEKVAVLPETWTVRLLVLRSVAVIPTERWRSMSPAGGVNQTRTWMRSRRRYPVPPVR